MHINISIIIPVYNPPHEMFERCIGSLMSQTGELGLEFIFVNDGSTDEWIAKRLERLEKKDRRVVVISKDNEGVSVARNIGIERAKGEYIAFCDADDVYETDAFAYMHHVALERDVDVAVFGISREHCGHETELSYVADCRKKRDMILSILSYRTASYSQKGLIIDSPWAKLFRHDIIKKHKICFDKTLCVSEDALFCAEFYEYAETVFIDTKPVYVYIENNSGLTRRYKKAYNMMIPRLIKAEMDLVDNYHVNDNDFIDAVAMRTFVALTHADHCYFIPRIWDKQVSEEIRTLWNDPTVHNAIKRNTFITLKCNGFGNMNYYLRLLIYKYKLTSLFIIMAKAISILKSIKRQ